MTVPTFDAHGDRQILMQSHLDAPRDIVFAAYTQPEYLTNWLGVFAGMTLPTCEVDLRPGGAYRNVWQNVDGFSMGMGGQFREVVPNERVVATEHYDEAWYPGEAIVTYEFSDADGGTHVRMTIEYESTEARDQVLATPMKDGMIASHFVLCYVLAIRG